MAGEGEAQAAGGVLRIRAALMAAEMLQGVPHQKLGRFGVLGVHPLQRPDDVRVQVAGREVVADTAVRVQQVQHEGVPDRCQNAGREVAHLRSSHWIRRAVQCANESRHSGTCRGSQPVRPGPAGRKGPGAGTVRQLSRARSTAATW